jgi:alpha-amylase/alpha-mannosidase (GH57 family)
MKIDQLFEDAVEPIAEKISARKQMTRVASRTIRDFKRKKKSIERGHLNYLKDLVHYKGMNKSPLEIDPDSKYDDKMTKIFSKLLELINIVRSYGMDDILSEYIQALEDNDIYLSFNSPESKFTEEELQEIKETIYKMNNFQTIICDNANIVKDELAPEAEKEDFSKASEFPVLAKIYYDKEKLEKDLTEKGNRILEKMDKTKKAYEYVLQ